jgi:hypothetical protein
MLIINFPLAYKGPMADVRLAVVKGALVDYNSYYNSNNLKKRDSLERGYEGGNLSHLIRKGVWGK